MRLGLILIEEFCVLFLNHNDNRNYPNDPDQKLTYPSLRIHLHLGHIANAFFESDLH